MENQENILPCWKTCPDCHGSGRKINRPRKKSLLKYKKAKENFDNGFRDIEPRKPQGQLSACANCNGSGLKASTEFPEVDTNFPHVAIIGGGIGGVALAVACLHRGIPFTLYERDETFDARSQGYGLTLQQASKAIQGLGVFELKAGVVSNRHVVHTTNGNIIGEWGNRKWGRPLVKKENQRTNIHIARQELRLNLMQQLGGESKVTWGHQLVSFAENKQGKIDLSFDVNGEIVQHNADLIVGADGIRSTVRNSLIEEEKTPLNYLGCIVILGICPLENLGELQSELLDSETVFQTANGNERIYMMPYTQDTIMWQLSFPMLEEEAKALSQKGRVALKEEAIKRCPWHSPIPEILNATNESKISGYPVYDRAILDQTLLQSHKKATILGDAAHPMSPFKGQGANQALLDALSLARLISRGCRPKSNWREEGIRNSVLNNFEEEMIERTESKVHASAEAAQLLHSDVVLKVGDGPRGKHRDA